MLKKKGVILFEIDLKRNWDILFEMEGVCIIYDQESLHDVWFILPPIGRVRMMFVIYNFWLTEFNRYFLCIAFYWWILEDVFYIRPPIGEIWMVFSMYNLWFTEFGWCFLHTISDYRSLDDGWLQALVSGVILTKTKLS